MRRPGREPRLASMVDVRRRLSAWDGRTTAELEDLSTQLEGRAHHPGDLVELFGPGDETSPLRDGDETAPLKDGDEASPFASSDEASRVAVGATWLYKRALENGATSSAADGRAIARTLDRLEPWAACLHVLQCMDRLVLDPRDQGAWQRFVERAAKSETTFVRAWALSGLHTLAETFEELRDAARGAVDEALGDPAASIRARARALAKRGFPERDVHPPRAPEGRSRRARRGRGGSDR